MKERIIIAATDKNNGLGNKGKLLWEIVEDLRRFRRLTTGNIVIMGRKTYESIGFLLPNRQNIVISSQNISFNESNGYCVNSIDEAFNLAENLQGDKIYIIGGGKIYESTINMVDKLEITEIDKITDADTYFPEIPDKFIIQNCTEWLSDSKIWENPKFRFVTYIKSE